MLSSLDIVIYFGGLCILGEDPWAKLTGLGLQAWQFPTQGLGQVAYPVPQFSLCIMENIIRAPYIVISGLNLL